METYTAWAKVPDNLKTKTQLSKVGLRPGKGQEAAAEFYSTIRGRSRPNRYPLFDMAEAVPKRQCTPEQLANLETARQKSLALRTCKCGEIVTPVEYRRMNLNGAQFVCRVCRDHAGAAAWARSVLADERAVILDTETTGLDEESEIIEISIIDVNGQVLLDTLVKPSRAIPYDVSAIHGIDNNDVAGAPAWSELDRQVADILGGASRVIIYNAEFDLRMIRQTRAGYELPAWKFNLNLRTECAMLWYSQWYGQWSEYYGDYKWQRLDGGHRALGDCAATLERIVEMAK